MTVIELINELKKIPNQEMDVYRNDFYEEREVYDIDIISVDGRKVVLIT